MKFNLLLATLFLQSQTFAAASSCAAMPQVTECVNSNLKTRLQVCSDSDYQCKCDAYDFVKACFLNCPNDPTAQGQAREYDGLKQNFCTSASLSKPVNTTTPTTNVTASTSTASDSKPAKGKDSSSLPSGTTGSNAFRANTPAGFLLVLSLVALSH